VSHYLHVSSRRPLMAAVRHTLLAVHVAAILDKGFSSLVDQSRLEDLGRMYSLFAQVRDAGFIGYRGEGGKACFSSLVDQSRWEIWGACSLYLRWCEMPVLFVDCAARPSGSPFPCCSSALPLSLPFCALRRWTRSRRCVTRSACTSSV
jgi:hypothetical protein